MLSRVAESIYWMNRYVERAENVARFIHVNLHLELDSPSPDAGKQWQPLVWTTGDEKQFLERHRTATRKNVLQFLTFEKENPNSIFSCIESARENARSVREVISSEMWVTLNRFYLMLQDRVGSRKFLDDPNTFYSDVKTACALFLGESISTMSHNEGYHFGRIGRFIERADKTSRILDVKYYLLLPTLESVGMPIDTLQWIALLKSASAWEMFRKRFSAITPRNVADFLLFDAEFPRAILHCIREAQTSLNAITDAGNPAKEQFEQLAAALTLTKIEDVIQNGLHQYLDGLQTQLNQADDAIFRTFFQLISDVPAPAVPTGPTSTTAV
jgi:uncharacterized alpha-E superfamily protein